MKEFMNEEKLSVLIDISKSNDDGLLNDLIDLFSTESLLRISEIKSAVQDKNMIQIYKSAKSLKSGASYIGAKKLCDISEDLERLASQGHIPRNVETIINELEYYYFQSAEYLDSIKAA